LLKNDEGNVAIEVDDAIPSPREVDASRCVSAEFPWESAECLARSARSDELHAKPNFHRSSRGGARVKIPRFGALRAKRCQHQGGCAAGPLRSDEKHQDDKAMKNGEQASPMSLTMA
jgi:hypothetical protein